MRSTALAPLACLLAYGACAATNARTTAGDDACVCAPTYGDAGYDAGVAHDDAATPSEPERDASTESGRDATSDGSADGAASQDECASQGLCELWRRIYDSGGGDYALGAAIDGTGSVLVAGYVAGAALANVDLWVRKYSADGEVLWTESYDGGGDDLAYGVAVDAQGNVLVAGETGGQTTDVWLRKYDRLGAELWTVHYDSGANDAARDLATDPAGNTFVVGSAGADGWIGKYDPEGRSLWTRTYDSGGVDLAFGVATFADGGGTVIGSAGVSGRDDIWLRRFDAAGGELWTVRYDGGSSDSGYGVAVDARGDLFATGKTRLQTAAGELRDHLWLRRYDGDGVALWTAVEPTSQPWSSNGSRVATVGGEVLVAGPDWLHRFSLDGRKLGEAQPPAGVEGAWGRGLAVDAQSGLVVAGNYAHTSPSSFSDPQDILTVRYRALPGN